MPGNDINPVSNISNDLLSQAIEEQQKKGIVTDEQKNLANIGLQRLKSGYQAILPLMCRGEECPMAKKCPLLMAGFDYMIGHECPIERSLLDNWTSDIIEKLQIDPNNHIEVGLAADLAKMDIYQMRVSAKLSLEDFIQDQVMGVDEEGVPIVRKELHQAALWDDMLSKRKLKYLEALLATRKSMAQAGAGQSLDPSTMVANVKAILLKKQSELRLTAESIKQENLKPTSWTQ